MGIFHNFQLITPHLPLLSWATPKGISNVQRYPIFKLKQSC